MVLQQKRWTPSLFLNSDVQEATFYSEGENNDKIEQASFTSGGREFICIDTPVKHDFGFAPAASIFVDCESDEEVALCEAVWRRRSVYAPRKWWF